MADDQATQEEVCPKCGEFCNQLLPATGWCWVCSQAFVLGINGKGVKICTSCNNVFGDETHSKCWHCREEDWLKEHANQIERYLAQGFSFTVAKDLVRIHHSKKLKCLRCGAFMKKASRGIAYFCMTNTKCRTANRKLKWQMYHHRVPREQALKIVLDSLDRTHSQEGPLGEDNRTAATL